MKLIHKIMEKANNMSYKAMALKASLPFMLVQMAEASTCNNEDGQGVGYLACNVSRSFNGLGDLFLGGCFLGGMGLSGMGIMKLRQASEDGGRQVKYSEGVWRLGVGAALIALPTVSYATKQTLTQGQNSSLQSSETVNNVQF